MPQGLLGDDGARPAAYDAPQEQRRLRDAPASRAGGGLVDRVEDEADDARHEEENKEYRRKRDAKKAGNPKGRREEKKTEGRKFSKREQLRSLAESSKKAAENFKNLMAAQQEQINRLSQAISNEDTSDSDSDSDKDF